MVKPKKIKISKRNFSKLPETNGVYFFLKKEKVIYVGKSINLRSRLKSYLSLNLGPKTSQMINEADCVSYIKTTSELEALILESDLIRKYMPKYNILSKDDKHALYIAISNDHFPRIFTCRRIDITKHQKIYGPYPSAKNVKLILKLLRKVFPYSDHKLGQKPCLYSKMNLCTPCPNLIVRSTEYAVLRNMYMENIRNIKLVLSRKFNTVRNNLYKEMNFLSKQEKYEEARIIRDKIQALDYITQKQIDSKQFLENPNLTEDLRSQEIKNLKSELNKNLKLEIKSLSRIECFDISHLFGTKATASMVTFINGEPEKKYYRHFKILQKNTLSDYDNMKEIATRRLKNINKWGRPNLIIVDGGIGQVKVFREVFDSLLIPVIGIAKNPDRLIFYSNKKIKLDGSNLHLVSRLRDEAHRFARRLHYKLISKDLLV